jgi:putative heme iron utilization protein
VRCAGAQTRDRRDQARPVTRAREAREVVRTHRGGVLSTQSSKLPGYPYGSALPHITDHLGRPVILISHLAEHTHNIEADARVSFIVHTAGADLQSRPRTTVVGEAHSVTDAEAIARRYLRYYPDHEQYLQIGGFRFYAIEPTQVRFIQGFGGLHWISGEHYLAPADLTQAETSILEHMNQDHGEALRAYCRHVHNIEPLDAQMIGIDCDGFDVRVDGQMFRFTFPELVTNSGQVRNALIALADEARK